MRGTDLRIPDFNNVKLPSDVPDEIDVLARESLRNLPDELLKGPIWLVLGFPMQDLSADVNPSGIPVRACSNKRISKITQKFLSELMSEFSGIPFEVHSGPTNNDALWILGIRSSNTRVLMAFGSTYAKLMGPDQQTINVVTGANATNPAEAFVSANGLHSYLLSFCDRT